MGRTQLFLMTAPTLEVPGPLGKWPAHCRRLATDQVRKVGKPWWPEALGP